MKRRIITISISNFNDFNNRVIELTEKEGYIPLFPLQVVNAGGRLWHVQQFEKMITEETK